MRAGDTGAMRAGFHLKVIFKPPVTVEDLKADTECDPEGAEEFVALIRTLRKVGSRPVTP